MACRCFEYLECAQCTLLESDEGPTEVALRLERVHLCGASYRISIASPRVNTFRTSERKSKESAEFGCQDTAHTRPLRSIVTSHPSLEPAAGRQRPLITTYELYRRCRWYDGPCSASFRSKHHVRMQLAAATHSLANSVGIHLQTYVCLFIITMNNCSSLKLYE